MRQLNGSYTQSFRGSIQKGQDGFPITNVGNDREGDGFSITYVGKYCREWIFDSCFSQPFWHTQNNVHEKFFGVQEWFVLSTDPSPLAQDDKWS
jgi:hypothetical protein